MLLILHAFMYCALMATLLVGTAKAQTGPVLPAAQPPRPTFETKKVEGTDNV